MPGAEPAARACALLAWLAASAAGAAYAEPAGPAWPDHARRASPPEYAAIPLLSLSALGLVLYEPETPRSEGPWLFDEGVRNALRIESESARSAVQTASDVGLWMTVGYPFFDAVLARAVLDADRRVPHEMVVQSALVLSFAAFVTYATKDAVARARPFAAACRADAGYSSQCADRTPTSFPSGHASLAFAAAAIACVQHAELGLYGDAAADAVACAGPLAVAAAVSLMRILSDQHYATDVLAGTAVGVLSGLGVGWLLHYRRDP